MRFKVYMINDIGKHYEETVIANNNHEAKLKVESLNQNSNVVNTQWVYK